MNRLVAFAVLVACLVTVLLGTAGVASAVGQPTCASTGAPPGQPGSGYLWAGFATTPLGVGSSAQASFADFGSALDPSDTTQSGHVLTWIDEDSESPNWTTLSWIQTGIGWFRHSLTSPSNQGGTFATQAFVYLESKVGTTYTLLAYPVPEQTYYQGKITRTATNTFTATIGGHSLTVTFTTTMQELQLEGENYQGTVNSPEPCNLAAQGIRGSEPRSDHAGVLLRGRA